MTDFLTNLPSGAWVLLGVAITALVNVVVEVWRLRKEDAREQRRDQRARHERAEFVSDRQRKERRAVYLNLITVIKTIQPEIAKEQAQEVDSPTYRNAWTKALDRARLSGALPDAAAKASLVASAPVRFQIDRTTAFLYGQIDDIVTGAFIQDGNTREDPTEDLVAFLAFELEYRDRAEADAAQDVASVVERSFRQQLEALGYTFGA